jgi:glutathione reductase (NADPH)
VTLLHRGEALLRGFDEDLRAALGEQLQHKGIALRLGEEVNAIERTSEGLLAHATGGPIVSDLCLCAIGRVPSSAGLGLEAAGVAVDPFGAVVVDAYMKTNVAHIYAVGDVTDRIQLTPVALAEGMAVAATLFDNCPTQPDHSFVPSAVFSQPPIGTVGYTEEQARRLFGELDVYLSRFRPLKHTVSGRDERALMKLIVARESQRVVGVHVLGPEAGEIVQGFAVALKLGATKRDLDRTLGIHPTAAEELVTMRTPRG